MRSPLPRAASGLAVLSWMAFFILPAPLRASGDCSFMLLKADENGTPIGAEKIPSDDQICVKALQLEARFNALRGGAAKWSQKVAEKSRTDGTGKPLEIKFDANLIVMSKYVDNVASPNAYYAYRRGSPTPGYIQVNVGFIQKESGDDGPAAFGLAHELSHGVQHSLGVDNVDCHRGHEAQADRWAASVLREAGFPGEKTPGMVSGFFGEDRIASESAFRHESEGCRAHPPGRTRFVNAVLGEELFGKKGGEGGSQIGKTLMELERGKILSAADVVFDGGIGRNSGPNGGGGAVPASGDSANSDFGSDGVLRESDFRPNGKLIVSKDLVPDLKFDPKQPEPPEESLTNVVLAQIYRLGNLTDWTSPFIGRVIASGVKEGYTDLKSAILAGLDNMAPGEIAKKNTLRLVVALQDSLGGGPVFASLRTRLAVSA